MKKLILSFCILIPLLSFGQVSELKSLNKLAVGIVFSPDYCYRSVSSGAGVTWTADSRNDMEVPKLGFTTGASVLYTLGNRFSLESGLLFADRGEKTKRIKYTTSQPDPAAPVYGKHNFHYLYLDIPAKVNYYLTTSKVKFFVSTGVSTCIFLKSIRTSEFEYSDGRIENKSGSEGFPYSRVNLMALAGTGIDISLTNKLQFRVEPIYRRSITSIINAPIKGYLTSAGVNMGIYYQL